jgi:hypothetical protein
MTREDELATLRDQVSILAEQVARLMDIISVRSVSGRDVRPAEEKMELLEGLMWKLHRRHSRLKAHSAAVNVADLQATVH